MRVFRRIFHFFQNAYFLTVLLVAVANLLASGATAPVEPARSLVAIGDVHGDFNDFCSILQRVGLIDEQRRWTGG